RARGGGGAARRERIVGSFHKKLVLVSTMRAPDAPSTRRSASRSTLSAWPRSFDTTQAVSSARCHRSWCAVSAAETLNRLCNRSLRLLSTWRLSLSERHPSRCSSQVMSPTTTAHPPRAALPTSSERATSSILYASIRSPTLTSLKLSIPMPDRKSTRLNSSHYQ